MNYLELIESVSEQTEMTKADVKRVFEAQREAIQTYLKKAPEGDEGVSLPGIGKFKVVKRAARNGINPATGESIKIKAKRAPVFKASTQLKEIVAKKKNK